LVNTLNPAYANSIPSSKALSGPLLDQKYNYCARHLEQILEASTNLTLVTDGWTNVRGEHITNFCIKAPSQKPFFYDSIVTSGTIQNAQGVAESVAVVLERLGPEKFISVITDNAPVMKAAWKIIMRKYSHISAYGCAAHCMNLLVKDILEDPDHIKIIKDSERIIKFVTNHHIVKAKYEDLRKLAKVPHTLTMPVVTRWFSRYTSMSNLLASKYVLTQLVDRDGDSLKEIPSKTNSTPAIKLIKSNEFWDQLSEAVKTIEYPSNIIGRSIFLIRLLLSICFSCRKS
jgi:Protein of unknown function (DUF 659)